MDASLACKNHHENLHVTIFCGTSGCNDWILFRRAAGSRLNGASIAVLIVCGLAALFLLRRTTDVWAFYAFLMVSLLNVFLVALSRGRALGAAAVSTAVSVLAWLVWWRWDVTDEAVVTWGPSVLLLVAVAYAYLAARFTTLETVRARGTYLAVLLVAVPGLWWAVGVSLENGRGYTTLVDVATVIGAVVPLVFILVSIGNAPGRVAAWLVAVSSYLTVVQPIVTGLRHLFIVVLPDILQAQRPVAAEPAWLVILRWKTAVSSIGFLAAFVLVVAFSVSAVVRRFRPAEYQFLLNQINQSANRQERATEPFTTLLEQVYRTTIKMARVVYIAAVFSARAAQEIGVRAWEVLARIWSAAGTAVRFFVLPLAALSAVGLILLAVVRELASYAGGAAGPADATGYWGGTLCAAAVILALCGAAFGFAALAPRTQRFSCNGVGVVVLLAGAFWVLVSLSTVATWPIYNALRSLGFDVEALALGRVLWTNDITMLVTAVVLILAALVSGGIQGRATSERPRIFMAILGISAVLFFVTAAWVGVPPLSQWVTHTAVRESSMPPP